MGLRSAVCAASRVARGPRPASRVSLAAAPLLPGEVVGASCQLEIVLDNADVYAGVGAALVGGANAGLCGGQAIAGLAILGLGRLASGLCTSWRGAVVRFIAQQL